MTVGSLFSGIGGLDLGFERAGFTIKWMCEKDEYARRVLRKHWAEVPLYDDIEELKNPPYVDVITGGFPCQDISLAGKGAGLDGDRSRLWWEMHRIISEVRPRYAVMENVAALANRGLGAVLGSLSEIGYDAEWTIVSAASVGAPHIRERLFIVALRNGDVADSEGMGRRNAHALDDGAASGAGDAPRDGSEVLADTEHNGLDEGAKPGSAGASEGEGRLLKPERHSAGSCCRWLPEPAVGGSLDGLSRWLDGSRVISESHKRVLAYAVETNRDTHATPPETRAYQALRTLRSALEAQQIQREAGRPLRVSSETVLLAYVRQLEERAAHEARIQLEGAQAPEGGLRGVRMGEEPTRAPRRSGHHEQQGVEHPDALQALSQLLARDAEAAWLAYRRSDAFPVGWQDGWEHALARVADGIPARVDRLRGLGNAVVPQVAEYVARCVMEHANTTSKNTPKSTKSLE